MSYSVLKRYTPPTCTLEIMAKRSPLSRWAGQPVLKHLRFQLSLDDPKLPKEQWVVLRGDRAQLDALCDVVQTYVQHFLEQSHSRLNTSFGLSHSDASPVSVAIPAPERVSPPLNTAGIALQQRGLLSHELVLGSLATEESGPVAQLSTLQLFDIANALDDYTTDVLALPALQRSRWLKTPPWTQVAAVALVVVGLSASVIKLMDGSYNKTADTESPTTSQGASSSDQKIATQLPPTAAATPNPTASSTPIVPPPPPTGSTTPVLPSMPTVTLPKAAPVSPNQSSGGGTVASKPSSASANRPSAAPAPPIVISQAPAGLSRSLPSVSSQRSQSAPSSSQFSGQAAEAPQAKQPAPTTEQTGTAFDTIPQVAEARSYFQQRWTPPQGLSQTLEYRLVIGADGTVQSISPLGQAAGDYVDRTSIPLIGEPLVSPLKRGRSAEIRLVLGADGTVQTFLEGLK